MRNVYYNFVFGWAYAIRPYKKEFCNKEIIAFYNESVVNPRGPSVSQLLKIEYDWGDGTADTTYAYSGTVPAPITTHAYDFPLLENKVYIKQKAIMLNNPIDRIPTGCEEEFIDSIIIRRPIADFTSDGHEFPCSDGGGGQGRNVQFTNQSQGAITHLYWSFEGIIGGSTIANPICNYKQAGKYDVLLIAVDSNGCIDSMLKKDYVNILGQRGSFFAYDDAGKGNCVPFIVDFSPSVNFDEPDYFLGSLTIFTGDGGALTSIGNNQIKVRSYVYRHAGAYLPLYILYKEVIFNGQNG